MRWFNELNNKLSNDIVEGKSYKDLSPDEQSAYVKKMRDFAISDWNDWVTNNVIGGKNRQMLRFKDIQYNSNDDTGSIVVCDELVEFKLHLDKKIVEFKVGVLTEWLLTKVAITATMKNILLELGEDPDGWRAKAAYKVSKTEVANRIKKRYNLR